ncbi:CNT family concentrative nucleoside transporter [Desulfitispora alkaliphila]|uniref:NupC/NupG family nucleoside CNT transporter n=1 Tax=Desulfitispora alkaliphila TaxID=622674 RepID=UPI003D1B85EF
MLKLLSVLGLFVFIGIAYLLSENRKSINWRLVVIGIGLQFGLAVFILQVSVGQYIFNLISTGVTRLLDFTQEGSSFLFGGFMDAESFGFVFALQVLPTIVFFSSLMAVLYYLGIMQIVITFLAKIMAKLLGVSGAESLAVTANIFIGQTEAPLVIRPYIDDMTNSELMTVMSGGMATVAGGVLAGYVAMGIDPGHLIAASVMSAPASLVFAKIMVPETKEPVTMGKVELEMEQRDVNAIDAAARGAGEGLHLALNVGAMLLAFIALVALLNSLLGTLGGLVGADYLSIEWILGMIFAPLAVLMGVPIGDMIQAGNLLGQKIVINEFFAYASLSTLIQEAALEERTVVILTYALCGFANFASIGIQIGGIGTLAPNRRSDIARYGIKALISGSLAAFLTATIAGILI